MSKTHLLLPDTQVTPSTPNDHIEAAARLIKEHQPDVIVHIGDHWDMESLSSYATQKELEGRRYQEDIDAGNRAIDIITDAAFSVGGYNPRLIFCIGNHEERIQRAIKDNPKLDGVLGYEDFNLQDWEVYDFLQFAEADGIKYTHYLANPMSGRPIGGSIDNMLNKAGFSFTTGHKQTFQYGIKYQNDGASHHGLVAGSFYLHDEGYKGPQGNHHWRGLVWKNNVKDGSYDIEPVSIDNLMRDFG